MALAVWFSMLFSSRDSVEYREGLSFSPELIDHISVLLNAERGRFKTVSLPGQWPGQILKKVMKSIG